MTATAFRSAWADPEFVRLASYRSWWDGTRKADRGLLPDGENPWLTDEHPERVPSPQPRGRVRTARVDEFAAWRCKCRHLMYEGMYPGCFCLVCKCCDHCPAVAA